MPTYTYVCPNCPDQRVTIARSIHDSEIKPVCITCAAEMKRNFVISNAIFKGSGFYSTDK